MTTQEQDEVQQALELLAQLKRFMADLEAPHRSLLARLLAPGVAQAYEDNEVSGFDGGWSPQPLPASLTAALHRQPLDLARPPRIERA